MESLVRKKPLTSTDRQEDRYIANLPIAERMNLFGELLQRGWSFYEQDETAKGYPRVYRIVALQEC